MKHDHVFKKVFIAAVILSFLGGILFASPAIAALTDGSGDISRWWTNEAGTVRYFYDLGAGNTAAEWMVEFDMKPSQNNMDGFFSFHDSSTTAPTFGTYAISVLLSTAGDFQVRDGGNYRKDATVTYAANQTYGVKIYVNLAGKTYDVWVNSGGTETKIATDYAFRDTTVDDLGKVVLWDNSTREGGVNWANEDDYWFTASNFEMSEVPIPGAVWLLGSGLAGLVALRRRKKS